MEGIGPAVRSGHQSVESDVSNLLPTNLGPRVPARVRQMSHTRSSIFHRDIRTYPELKNGVPLPREMNTMGPRKAKDFVPGLILLTLAVLLAVLFAHGLLDYGRVSQGSLAVKVVLFLVVPVLSLTLVGAILRSAPAFKANLSLLLCSSLSFLYLPNPSSSLRRPCSEVYLRPGMRSTPAASSRWYMIFERADTAHIPACLPRHSCKNKTTAR